MSEKIIYRKKTRKVKGSHRLLLKNGIKYTISITENKKHKFKKIKQFKVRKWNIPNVFLNDFEIVDKKEIEAIIKLNKDEQKAYDNVFALDIKELYDLHLTNKQYETFKRFLDIFEMKINEKFCLQRKGKGLKTIIEFSIAQETNDSEKPEV